LPVPRTGCGFYPRGAEARRQKMEGEGNSSFHPLLYARHRRTRHIRPIREEITEGIT